MLQYVIILLVTYQKYTFNLSCMLLNYFTPKLPKSLIEGKLKFEQNKYHSIYTMKLTTILLLSIVWDAVIINGLQYILQT